MDEPEGSEMVSFPSAFMTADEAKKSLLMDTYEDSSFEWQSSKTFLSKLSEFDPENPKGCGGAVMYVHEGKIFVDNDCTHTLLSSATGVGKTQLFLLPSAFSCIISGESAFIIDPKEECRTRLKPICDRLGIENVVLDLRRPAESNAVHLLKESYLKYRSGEKGKSEAICDIEKMALSLIPDEESRSNDKYWTQCSRSALCGSIVMLFETYDNIQKINFSSAAVLVGKVFDDGSEENRYVKNLPDDSYINQCFIPLIRNADTTAKSVYGSFRGYMAKFSSNKELNKLMFTDESEIFDMGDRQKVIFLIMPDDSGAYFSIASLITSMLIQRLYERSSREPNCALPVRCNILLDEFGVIPPIPDVDVYLSTSRSRNIRWMMCIQSFSQLNSRYCDKAGAILGNVSNLMFMYSQEIGTLDMMQKLLGKTDEGEPLMSISELQSIPFGRAVVIRKRMKPFITFLDRVVDSLCPIPADPPKMIVRRQEKEEKEEKKIEKKVEERKRSIIEVEEEEPDHEVMLEGLEKLFGNVFVEDEEQPPELDFERRHNAEAIIEMAAESLDIEIRKPKKVKASEEKAKKVGELYDSDSTMIENGAYMLLMTAVLFKKRGGAVDALSRRVAMGLETKKSSEAMSMTRDALSIIDNKTYKKLSSRARKVIR
ncbi:MAG: type IV secretory system conjugative DNA transfer family protein [Candidatus Methanomethylophilaceae archaeon]|nr:type IV secretory system conjugative DNA transfer family protein [Candidatus Methanomethylophilaceae archaeon]